MSSKRSSPDIALEVDLLILDYFLVNATRAILERQVRSEQPEKEQRSFTHDAFVLDDEQEVERKLAIFNTFFTLFKANHPAYTISSSSNIESIFAPKLHAKLQLLNLTNLFFRRHKSSAYLPSLSALSSQRSRNSTRAASWRKQRRNELARRATIANDNGSYPDSLGVCEASAEVMGYAKITLPPVDRESTRFLAYTYLDGNPSEMSQDSDGSIRLSQESLQSHLMLMDILPQFIQIIATMCHFESWKMRPRLMEMMAEFMLHASMERLLMEEDTSNVFDIVDDTFAWGHIDGAEAETLTEQEQLIQKMYSEPVTKKSTQSCDTTAATSDGDTVMHDADAATITSSPQQQQQQFLELEDWTSIRNDYRCLFIPPLSLPPPQAQTQAPQPSPTLSQTEWSRHLRDLASTFKYSHLTDLMLQFAQSVLAELGEPVLAELERDGEKVLARMGFSIEEIERLRIRIGMSI